MRPLCKRDVQLSKVELKAEDKTVTLAAGEAEGVLIERSMPRITRRWRNGWSSEPPNTASTWRFPGIEKPLNPGAPVKLTVTTTDDNGKPISANVGLTVIPRCWR